MFEGKNVFRSISASKRERDLVDGPKKDERKRNSKSYLFSENCTYLPRATNSVDNEFCVGVFLYRNDKIKKRKCACVRSSVFAGKSSIRMKEYFLMDNFSEAH